MSGSVRSCPSRKCHLSFPKMWAHCNNLKAFSSVVRSPKRSECQELCRPVMTVGSGPGLRYRWRMSHRRTAVSLIRSSGEEPLPPTVQPSSCLVIEMLTRTQTDSRIRINLLTILPAFATSFIRAFSIYQNSTRLKLPKDSLKGYIYKDK